MPRTACTTAVVPRTALPSLRRASSSSRSLAGLARPAAACPAAASSCRRPGPAPVQPKPGQTKDRSNQRLVKPKTGQTKDRSVAGPARPAADSESLRPRPDRGPSRTPKYWSNTGQILVKYRSNTGMGASDSNRGARLAGGSWSSHGRAVPR
jgi:hypothetical protein